MAGALLGSPLSRVSGLAPPRCPLHWRSPGSAARRLSGTAALVSPAVTNTCFSACRPSRPRSHAPSYCDETLFGAKPPGAAWAAPRMRKEDVAKLHSLLWSPPPAPRSQPGLSAHCTGTPLRAVHPPASAPPATSEPGRTDRLCGWRQPGSDACPKGWGAPGRGRSQSVSRIRLPSSLGTERWKNQSAPTTPAAPQGTLVRARSNSVSGSPVLRSAKAAGGCKARPPWK